MEQIIPNRFGYTITDAEIPLEGRAGLHRVTILEIDDDEHGVSMVLWFPPDRWRAFQDDILAGRTPGIEVASADEVKRLGA